MSIENDLRELAGTYSTQLKSQINTIHEGDCLEVLDSIEKGSIDLAYLDPPFFTEKKHSLKTRDRTQEFRFDDIWGTDTAYSRFLLECICESVPSLRIQVSHRKSPSDRLIYGRQSIPGSSWRMNTEVLSSRQLERIGSYVKEHLPQWMSEARPDESVRSFDCMGCIIRLEEAVVRQGDLIEKLIHQIDRRLEQSERRIERIDKRISLMFTVMTSITSLVGAGVVVAQFIG